MKKIVSLVLALALVLSVASVAMAFTWGAGSSTTSESFANRYKIEVVKLAKQTGIVGSSSLVEAPGATAVNSAPVYFYIRLTISGADVADPDDVQKYARAEVSLTALTMTNNVSNPIDLSGLGNGVYYFDPAGNTPATSFVKIGNNSNSAGLQAICADTSTAKVYAKVTSKNVVASSTDAGDFKVSANGANVVFTDGTAANTVTFTRNTSNGKVTGVSVGGSNVDGNFAPKLYAYLGITAADISDGKVYMTDDNLRAAFGFSYKVESSITWNANSTPIILDPNVGIGIPKTGDNTSVIGFAMVMIAIVAGAVAMKKVKA